MLIKEYLEGVQRSWDTYGKEDPMWAIIVDPKKVNNKWDENDFFNTGKAVAESVMGKAVRLGYPTNRKTFLDFGCGIGRLTQGFSKYFNKCIGVDIAPSMISKAREYNKYGPKVVYLLNETNDLSQLKSNSIDMIYTEHVLQHMHPILSKKYIQEMLRVLNPGGLFAFHVPSALARLVYPREGLSAAIRIVKKPFSAEACSFVNVPLVITNTGQHAWVVEAKVGVSRTPMRVVDHWIEMDTKEWTAYHHGYQALPQTMQPGDTQEMDYKLRIPSVPGRYLAIFDISDCNGVTFQQRGGAVAAIEVAVSGTPVLPESAAEKSDSKRKDKPTMEMHAVAIEEVKSIITAGRGKLLEVETRDFAPDHHAYARYFVTK